MQQYTEYEFRISAKIDIGRREVTIISAPFNTTTLPPLTFGRAEVLWMQGNGIEGINMRPTNFQDVHFSVFESAYIRLGGTRWGLRDNREDNIERYEFKFEVPSATGFQITDVLRGPTGIVVKNHAVCDWETWPSDSSDWMEWRPHVKLVRCGVGDGMSWITIKVRNTEHEYYEWEARTIIPVKPAWHRADHNLAYQTVCLPSPTASLDYAAGIDLGASYWNDRDKYGISLTKLPQRGCKDIIERYERVTVEIYSHGDHDGCGSVVAACARQVTWDYPHRITQSILINGDLKWQSVTVEDEVADDAYYLPDTVAHEFGHTAGLGHPFDRGLIMTAGAKMGDVQGSLTKIDELAIKSIYKTHTEH